MADFPEPPLAGSDVETMVGALDRQRTIFAWKTGGLDEAGLNATVGASSMTLGGLLKHLALVEREYIAVRLHGLGYGDPWESADWSEGTGWEWRSAASDTPEYLYKLWTDAVADSRRLLAQALEDGGLDQRLTKWAAWDDPGERPTLRRIMADLIEEYARHVGHADLIRESVDGLVGEDPPH
jgi:hypothetical protein